jgi:hypothetical protein
MWDSIRDFFLFLGGFFNISLLLIVLIIIFFVQKMRRKKRQETSYLEGHENHEKYEERHKK